MAGVIQGPGNPWSHSGSERSFADFLESRGLGDREQVGIGLNPILKAAWPVLLLAADIRLASEPRDLAELRRQMHEALHAFGQRARTFDLPDDVIESAHYVLCAALDESVLSNEFGQRSHWAYQPLQAARSGEPGGGERFFEMLGRLSQKPDRHLFMLELQYLCLALGFAGRYRTLPRGQEQLRELQRELGHKIRKHRWKTTQPASSPEPAHRAVSFTPHVLSWIGMASAIAIMASIFTAFSARLANEAAPVLTALADIGIKDFPVPTLRAPTAATIKQRLAAEETRGELGIEERDGQTRITLLAADLFASGTATLNPVHVDLLGRVAAALSDVPGGIRVVGHTDNQPMVSLRYRDNVELSVERASAVAQVLMSSISARQIETMGVGSSQPRYVPESTPENRARNRRVEIIHFDR